MIWVRVGLFRKETLSLLKDCFKFYSTAMNNVYLRHEEGAEQFQVSFQWNYQSLNIDRQFNFNRKYKEPIEVFLERIKANLEKTVEKKINRKKKKNSPQVPSEEWHGVNVKITEDGQEVCGNICCDECFFQDPEKKTFMLHVLDRAYKIIVNPPWVMTLSLPSSIMAGFPLYPNRISILFGERHSSDFKWFKMDQKNNWVEVCHGFVYIPNNSDIDHKIKLKCVPGNGKVYGPAVEIIASGVVEAGPGFCPFEDRHSFTQESSEFGSFRIMSYNILADIYAETDVAKTELFPYCSPYAINIDYRKQLLTKEILGYNADIICLQEVDVKLYEYDLLDLMQNHKYHGSFGKKGKTVNEGVATFFSTRKFRLLEEKRALLAEEVENNPLCSHILNAVRSNENLSKRLLERANVVQVLVLKSLEKEKEILVVANTHLYFSPEADNIRLLQGGIIISLLSETAKSLSEQHPDSNVSLVLCGDFNSTPEFGIYELMTNKYIPADYLDWKSKKGEEVNGLELKHNFPLASAYGNPVFTNYTVNFAGCLDYIFYQTDNLHLKEVVPFPTEEVVKQHTALPSVVFPSDHLALVTVLSWK